MYSFGVTLHFNKNVIPTFWSNFGITLLPSPLGGVFIRAGRRPDIQDICIEIFLNL